MAKVKTKKLSKKTKTKWIKALLSGKYTQGAGELKRAMPLYEGLEEVGTRYEYCCLGVACSIGIAQRQDEGFCTTKFLDEGTQDKLAAMNDGTGEYKKSRSFKQIAKWIEKNL